ncbi:MAG: hypothetical protein LRY53_03840 [Burkholderiaceae bacterium]|nr:hypothetical protein [Burkholderiaceae bacterium]MCD8516649.1 hypothetical protein [Burkholderiaceae bacterium]MCD8537962.1 hypothetical protein [Burkholderiaceae bacterium]MCD8564777.1 hypothetical protein [Burkholderiaceae bacterium]
MPIAGKGILITSMNIDPAHEDEFNLWYDREHVAERVAIDGFIEARRYQAVDANPKYFATYTTSKFEDLSSPAYQRALANQTEWSKVNIARFKDMIRVVGRITASCGQGRGAAMAVVRIRPNSQQAEQLRQTLKEDLNPGNLQKIISLHLIESDPELSKSLTEPDKPNPGAADWFVLVEGTSADAVTNLARTRFFESGAEVISMGTYQLLWDLAKAEL